MSLNVGPEATTEQKVKYILDDMNASGSMFYKDTAEAEDLSACELCDGPAELMTFVDDEDEADLEPEERVGIAYYICYECAKQHGLYHKVEPVDRRFDNWADVVTGYDKAEHPIKVRYGNHEYGAFISDMHAARGVLLSVPAIHETWTVTQAEIIAGLNGTALTKGGNQ